MEQIECVYDKYIKDFKCKYYITKTVKKFIKEEDLVNTYGVKIDKFTKSGCLIETASVKDVGINESDVKLFIKSLSDGQVTPVTLKDIVEDNV